MGTPEIISQRHTDIETEKHTSTVVSADRNGADGKLNKDTASLSLRLL